MARLVLHARYFAPNAAKREGHLSYLMKYYETRDGVEKNKDETWTKEPKGCNIKQTIIWAYRKKGMLFATYISDLTYVEP